MYSVLVIPIGSDFRGKWGKRFQVQVYVKRSVELRIHVTYLTIILYYSKHHIQPAECRE